MSWNSVHPTPGSPFPGQAAATLGGRRFCNFDTRGGPRFVEIHCSCDPSPGLVVAPAGARVPVQDHVSGIPVPSVQIIPREHSGMEAATRFEPSLIMPGIINSCIFSEQTSLVHRAVPLQNQFASSMEILD